MEILEIGIKKNLEESKDIIDNLLQLFPRLQQLSNHRKCVLDWNSTSVFSVREFCIKYREFKQLTEEIKNSLTASLKEVSEFYVYSRFLKFMTVLEHQIKIYFLLFFNYRKFEDSLFQMQAQLNYRLEIDDVSLQDYLENLISIVDIIHFPLNELYEIECQKNEESQNENLLLGLDRLKEYGEAWMASLTRKKIQFILKKEPQIEPSVAEEGHWNNDEANLEEKTSEKEESIDRERLAALGGQLRTGIEGSITAEFATDRGEILSCCQRFKQSYEDGMKIGPVLQVSRWINNWYVYLRDTRIEQPAAGQFALFLYVALRTTMLALLFREFGPSVLHFNFRLLFLSFDVQNNILIGLLCNYFLHWLFYSFVAPLLRLSARSHKHLFRLWDFDYIRSLLFYMIISDVFWLRGTESWMSFMMNAGLVEVLACLDRLIVQLRQQLFEVRPT
jgi:hypothetical protein